MSQTGARSTEATTSSDSAPSADPFPAHVRRASFPKPTLLLGSIATGALLFLSYFPVAWGALAWFALAPLLFVIRAEIHPVKRFALAFFAALIFYVAALSWMRVAHPAMRMAWIALSVYCAAYFPLVFWIGRRLERSTSVPLTVIFPTVWIAFEYVRVTYVSGGFSWYLLGYSQQSFLPLIQIADLAGVYGVSLLVVTANVVVFEMLYRSERARSWLGGSFTRKGTSRVTIATSAMLLLVLFAASLAYGSWRLRQQNFEQGPRLAMVQGNLSQDVRNDRNNPDESKRTSAADEMEQHYVRLHRLAVPYKADLIIWPETSWPSLWPRFSDETLNEEPFESQERLLKEIRRAKTGLLIGLNKVQVESRDRRPKYNTAMLFDATGRFVADYDKMHRVPFGEYVPLRKSIPLVQRLAPYDYDYEVQEGKSFTRFPVKDYRFGVLICYEDTVPLARNYVAGAGAKVDFLVNVSNDGWFKGTHEHEEHLAICRFRAIESRRSVVRTVNMGISGVIDGNGRVLRPKEIAPHKDAKVWEIPAGAGQLPESAWSDFKKVQGVMLAEVPIDSRSSCYAWIGDWLPALCWIGIAGMIVTPLIQRVRRKAFR